MPEQQDYKTRKAGFQRMLTVYGRKAVLEALADQQLDCRILHLAASNRDTGIVADIRRQAEARDVAIRHHSREELARISRNGRQDQGVALDVLCPGFRSLPDFLALPPRPGPRRLLALDGISNPQNLGMIIRSATAGGMDGIVLARRGNAALGPLVIKASAGTVFRAPLLHCEDLPEALQECRRHGARVYALSAESGQSLFDIRDETFTVYVLGNETEGVSGACAAAADGGLAIPMANGVESLNVAITAGLIAYAAYLER